MKRYEELHYYEILEIPINASSFEIRQAYKDALSTYDEDSLITYSLFKDKERDKILKKIKEAFFTLIDENKRADYDRILVNNGKVDASLLTKKKHKKPIPLFQTGKSKNRDAILKRIRNKVKGEDLKEISSEILSKESVSGDDLKKLRQAMGIELEEIYEITRINVSILKSIENNQFGRLPPIIYLKNFLKSYTEILQIDSKRIVDGYMKNMDLIEKRI